MELKHQKPAEENRKAARKRPCITCREPFPSEGAHNRMCDPCRKRSDPLGMGQVVAPPSRRRAGAS